MAVTFNILYSFSLGYLKDYLLPHYSPPCGDYALTFLLSEICLVHSLGQGLLGGGAYTLDLAPQKAHLALPLPAIKKIGKAVLFSHAFVLRTGVLFMMLQCCSF